MSQNKCLTCRHFEETKLECRAHPPTIHPVGGGGDENEEFEFTTLFPATTPDLWCSHHAVS